MMAARWALCVLAATAPCSTALFSRRGPARTHPLLLTSDDDLTSPITKISLSSTIIPRNVLRDAARASGIHDTVPPDDAPARLAASIDTWYRRNGYVLARVSGRSVVRAGRLHLQVIEPKVAPQPVALSYYAAAQADKTTGQVADDANSEAPQPEEDVSVGQRMSRLRAALALRDPPAIGAAAAPTARAARLEAALRRAREAGVAAGTIDQAEARLHGLRQQAGLPSLGPIERMYASGSLVAVSGATRERVVARALHLRPGEPFRWDAQRWEQLRRCGLFEEAEARARLEPPAAPQQPDPPSPRGPRIRNNTVFVECGATTEVKGAVIDAPYPAAHASSVVRRNNADEVSVVLSVVERDARPNKPSQHCRVEPGIALAGGRLAGELALYDHNLGGRNQQLRLDVQVRNSTELRASVHDPRLGSRFGWDARAFRRDISLRPAGLSEAAEDSVEAVPPTTLADARPTAGVDVNTNGRAWRGATVGFGASAEVVPTPAEESRRSQWLARLVGGGGKEASHETPLVVTASLGFGSLQHGGASERRGAVRAGAKVGIARSLPFVTSHCPDYWRFKCEGRLTLPLVSVLRQEARQRAQPTAAAPLKVPRWRRIGAPAHAYPSGELARRLGSAPLLGDLGRALGRATFTCKGRSTLAPDSLPAYEAEALGGDAAVRGYDDQELGRTHSSVGATAEVMLPINGANEAQPIGVALFADVGAGTVALPTGGMERRTGSCAGVGVRYGPFRIDYAFNRERKRKVHVTLVAE